MADHLVIPALLLTPKPRIRHCYQPHSTGPRLTPCRGTGSATLMWRVSAVSTTQEHSKLLWRAFWGVLFMVVFWFILGLVHRVQLKLASAVNTLLFLKAKFPNFYMLPVSSGPAAPASASSGLTASSLPLSLLSPPSFLSHSCLASELFPIEAGHRVKAHQ